MEDLNYWRIKDDLRVIVGNIQIIYPINKFVGMQLILLSKKSFYLISENIKDTRPCVKVQKSLMLYL